nr:protein SENSITIVE TO PROTON RHIZOTOXICITY 1-like [Ipomoea trifida]
MSLEFRVPLLNLANVQAKMDSLQKFLSTSVTSNILLSEEQIGMVPIEISTTIHRIIVNRTALIAAKDPAVRTRKSSSWMRWSCAATGAQPFLRDMQKGIQATRKSSDAHANQFKPLEALAKPGKCGGE